MEEWKPVVGYEGLYEVSDLGNVRSLGWVSIRSNGWRYTSPPKKLKHRVRGKRYLCVKLYKDQQSSDHSIHRLVAKAFIPNPENLPIVNHKKGIVSDNRVTELEWCSEEYNREHANKVLRSFDHRKKMVRVKNLLSGKEFIAASIKEAARVIGGSRAGIRLVLDGKCVQHKKYTFQEI